MISSLCTLYDYVDNRQMYVNCVVNVFFGGGVKKICQLVLDDRFGNKNVGMQKIKSLRKLFLKGFTSFFTIRGIERSSILFPA